MGDPKENRRLKERTRAARAKEVVAKKRKSRAYREGKRVNQEREGCEDLLF